MWVGRYQSLLFLLVTVKYLTFNIILAVDGGIGAQGHFTGKVELWKNRFLFIEPTF